MKYVAFLRGINVGGQKLVSMTKLRDVFSSLGFQNVVTLLVSGNVLFDAASTKPAALTVRIEKKLKEAFGHEIGVVLRSLSDLQKLGKSDPFKKIKVTPETRLYVTFLREKSKKVLEVAGGADDFRILRVSDTEVCTVVTLSPGRQTTDMMRFMDKELGRTVTTRNWNTILKVLKSDSAS